MTANHPVEAHALEQAAARTHQPSAKDIAVIELNLRDYSWLSTEFRDSFSQSQTLGKNDKYLGIPDAQWDAIDNIKEKIDNYHANSSFNSLKDSIKINHYIDEKRHERDQSHHHVEIKTRMVNSDTTTQSKIKNFYVDAVTLLTRDIPPALAEDIGFDKKQVEFIINEDFKGLAKYTQKLMQSEQTPTTHAASSQHAGTVHERSTEKLV